MHYGDLTDSSNIMRIIEATKPDEINLNMVMNHLGSPLNLLECMKTPDSCEKTSSCGQRPVWQKVEKAVSDVLNSTTISDLIE